MKAKYIEVRKGGNVRVKIYVTTTRKNGQAYTEYKVCDYITIPGKRKFWAFAEAADARQKANELAESIANGPEEPAPLTEYQKRELAEAVDMLRPFQLNLKMAVSLFCEAMEIIGGQPGHLRIAAQFYKTNRPDRPFEPKRSDDAVTEFLAAQKEIVCQRRHQALTCYLGQFLKEFIGRKLHELTKCDMEAFLEKKRKWSPKTTNDFLGMIGQLYKFAQKGYRNWVPPGYNPAKDIDRLSAGEADVELMEPDEAEQMFQRIHPDLIPFLVLWCFTGCRKEEAARITWQQINSALKTGELELRKDQTKNGRARKRRGARKMPLLPNARAWLEWWLNKYGPKDSGMVLPLRWNSLSQLNDLPKFIRRNTAIVWKENGPRNSYITYRCKITGNVVDVADEAGNSPAKIERHYRAKSVLLDKAQAWFNLMPPTNNAFAPSPKPKTAPVPALVTPIAERQNFVNN
jgi:integrase